jgi:hypothetical protein
MQRWFGITLIFLLAACTHAPRNSTPIDPQANYWQQLGSVVGTGWYASLASDGTSNTMAFSEYNGFNDTIRVKKWTGTSWTNLGSALSTASSAYTPSLALDSSGNPVVAWHESDGSVVNIYVQRFDGTNWVPVGTGGLSGSSAASSNALNPSLALDSSGNPVVAWHEYDGSNSNIYVRRFAGTYWANVGSGVLGAAGSDMYSN